jgi:hypothetical protein
MGERRRVHGVRRGQAPPDWEKLQVELESTGIIADSVFRRKGLARGRRLWENKCLDGKM